MVKKSSLQAINDDSRFDTLGWGDDEVAEEIELNENEDSEQNSENEEEDEEVEEENEEGDNDEEEIEGENENESDNNSDKEIAEADNSDEKSATPKKLKKNQIKDLEAFNQKVSKSGVVYLSRIPPRLKPSKLRTLLEDRGAKIGRIYLAPEDLHSKNRRKATGGGNDRRFTEGWVEFEDKKKAKAYAAFLNTTPMNPKKRSFHHEDLWNLKYLPKFKWHHLTERMDYDKASRNQLLTFEIQQGRKEASNYTDKVELANRIQHFEKKKREQGIEVGDEGKKKYKREFDQRDVQESELSNRQIKKIKHKLRVQGGKGGKDSKSNASKPSAGGMDDVLSRMFT